MLHNAYWPPPFAGELPSDPKKVLDEATQGSNGDLAKNRAGVQSENCGAGENVCWPM